jgi:thymidylate synthase
VYHHADYEYLDLATEVLRHGTIRKNERTGTGTISLFGPQMEFDLSKGFPLLTTKKLPFRVIAEEDFWFDSGKTDLRSLLDRNVNIWNADAYRWHRTLNPESTMSEERFLEVVRQGDSDFLGLGDLGPIYGKQFRNWGGIDQLANVIEKIKNLPEDRRLVVSAWNVEELNKMALPPCHVLYQFYVENGRLSCKLYQRSADLFLGVPFNIAGYAFKTHKIAKMVGLEVGRFIHTFGDVHIYLNHVDQIKEQMTRDVRPMPKLEILTAHERIEDYTMADVKLTGYDPHPVIKGKVSVGD